MGVFKEILRFEVWGQVGGSKLKGLELLRRMLKFRVMPKVFGSPFIKGCAAL